jgi:hypothetical protein
MAHARVDIVSSDLAFGVLSQLSIAVLPGFC